MDELFQSVRLALAGRGFEVYAVPDAAAARDRALSLISPESSVGVGGSMTVRQLGDGAIRVRVLSVEDLERGVASANV